GKNQKGHDGPLNPPHRNVDAEIRNEVFWKTGHEGRDQGGAEKINQNAKEQSEQQANSAIEKGAAKYGGILRPENAQTEIAPGRVTEEFAAKIEESFHHLHGPVKNIILFPVGICPGGSHREYAGEDLAGIGFCRSGDQ